jgi:hypothetical protein
MTKPLRADPQATKTYSRQVKGGCLACGREWKTRNALAVAAIHARSHGHRVKAVIKSTVIYDGTQGQ